ncbi:MAG: putative nucleotide-diphospho-sugar transferase [Paracoccaceae bacterium]
MPEAGAAESDTAGAAPATRPDRGFVFAATGAAYVDLARRTARNLAAVAPGAAIDLFADRAVDDPVFAAVHRLDHQGTRPKMEALRRSRFARTLYLDCDVVAVADPSDAFDMLDAFDVVGAHEQYGASPVATHEAGDIPAAFRQINSGVLGIRAGAQVDALLRAWEAGTNAADPRWDQPVLRRLLWGSRLRVGILPPEYNLMHTGFLAAAGRRMAGPRLLHLTELHEVSDASRDPTTPVALDEALGPAARDALAALIAGDVTLGGRPLLRDRASAALRAHPAAHRGARTLWRALRRRLT